MTRIKGQLTTADYLPYKEFLRLLDALDRDGEYLGETYCWLSFCTAFRASDVRTLKWKDVLGKKELVRIEQKTQKSRKVKFNAGVVEKTAGLYEKLGPAGHRQLHFCQSANRDPLLAGTYQSPTQDLSGQVPNSGTSLLHTFFPKNIRSLCL